MVMGSTQRQTMICCCALNHSKNIASIVLCVHTLRRNDGIFAVHGNFLGFVWICMSFGQFETKRRSFSQLTSLPFLFAFKWHVSSIDHDDACYLIAFFPKNQISVVTFFFAKVTRCASISIRTESVIYLKRHLKAHVSRRRKWKNPPIKNDFKRSKHPLSLRFNTNVCVWFQTRKKRNKWSLYRIG